jgi:hypothetical protein
VHPHVACFEPARRLAFGNPLGSCNCVHGSANPKLKPLGYKPRPFILWRFHCAPMVAVGHLLPLCSHRPRFLQSPSTSTISTACPIRTCMPREARLAVPSNLHAGFLGNSCCRGVPPIPEPYQDRCCFSRCNSYSLWATTWPSHGCNSTSKQSRGDHLLDLDLGVMRKASFPETDPHALKGNSHTLALATQHSLHQIQVHKSESCHKTCSGAASGPSPVVRLLSCKVAGYFWFPLCRGWHQFPATRGAGFFYHK